MLTVTLWLGLLQPRRRIRGKYVRPSKSFCRN